MGFYLMVASMLLGLLALKIGFSQFKEKKDKFLSILTSLAGTALVLVAVWLGWQINRKTSVKPRFFK
ncbi:TPA: YczI family protein [Streptococcus pneumoniae]|nr:YczI family protein [Streptococcus pneumoniae]